MKRIRLTLALLLLASFPVSQAADRPNVLVIVADDLGNADVGFQGCQDIPTPNLDALAASGVKFTHGYVSHPFCSPTRAGLLTGRYQQRFGHESNPRFDTSDTVSGLPLGEATLPQMLKTAGYVTGHVGKWHLGAAECFHPLNRGFDETFGFLGGGHQYFAETLGKPKNEYLTDLHRGRELVKEKGYLTDIFGREATAFIERHQAQPFFLYLAFNAPHAPLQAPPERLAKFAGIADVKRRTYAAMVNAMDDAIGMVIAKLHALKLEENTLIFFLSDNGGPVEEHNSNGSSNGIFRGGKGTVFEGGIRVPFIARWKGHLPEGQTYDQPVISLDIAATSLALAGVKPVKPLDGVDLLPFVLGGKSGLPHEQLCWRQSGGTSFAVLAADRKLVIADPKSAPAVFDLEHDQSEKTDIAGREPETLKTLEARRVEWNTQLIRPVFGGKASDKQKAPGKPD
jgi:arylsulfatase A-like enzyme